MFPPPFPSLECIRLLAAATTLSVVVPREEFLRRRRGSRGSSTTAHLSSPDQEEHGATVEEGWGLLGEESYTTRLRKNGGANKWAAVRNSVRNRFAETKGIRGLVFGHNHNNRNTTTLPPSSFHSTYPGYFPTAVTASSPAASGSQPSKGISAGSDRSPRVSCIPSRLPLPFQFRGMISRVWVAAQLRAGLDPINRVSAPSSLDAPSALLSPGGVAKGQGGKPVRKRLVILGSGWAAMSVLSSIDVRKYDVTIISPRNYFTFTPFLPSICAGTLSPRSCIEPIRRHVKVGGKQVMRFYEATGEDIDTQTQTIKCRNKDNHNFSINYDLLVVAVGATSTTFGIEGADKYSKYLKDIENALDIHKKILDNFEAAALPGISEAEKSRLLHFIVVGGGPTGVEAAGEISDFIHDDLLPNHPTLRKYAKVSVIEMLPKLLPMFTEGVSNYTKDLFTGMQVNCLLNSRVTKVTDTHINIIKCGSTLKQEKEESIPYGFIVWASGLGQTNLSKTLLRKVKYQNKRRILAVDPQLRLMGIKNIFALGDCCVTTPPLLHSNTALVNELFDRASSRPSGASTEFLADQQKELQLTYPQLAGLDFNNLPKKSNMTKREFLEYLKELDKKYEAPGATAQTANQQGDYLANILNSFYVHENSNRIYDNHNNDNALDGVPFTDLQSVPPSSSSSTEQGGGPPAFVLDWRGYLAYIGEGNAVADLPGGYSMLGGYPSLLLWRVVYLSLIKSMRTRCVMVTDWARTAIGGRDVGRDQSRQDSVEPPTKTNSAF